jgi:hypothetical protein
VESVLEGFEELHSLVDHIIVVTTRSDLRIEDRQHVLALLQRGLKHIVSVVDDLIEISRGSQLPRSSGSPKHDAQQAVTA